MGLIRVVVDAIRESFKTYTPEELREKENIKIVWNNQAIRAKYAKELQPKDWEVQALRSKVLEEKSEYKRRELSEQLIISEREYLQLLISKGHKIPKK